MTDPSIYCTCTCSGNKHACVPAITGHPPDAVSMLGQRRRRCANIETALGECPVFAGVSSLVNP